MINVNEKTIIVGGLVAVGLYLFMKSEASAAASNVAAAVDPTSHDNIFHRGFVKLAQSVNPDYQSGDIFCAILGGCDVPEETFKWVQ